MRLKNWFISNLDDSQRQIIVQDPDKNLIVQGSAGSGKTNLAIHRALQSGAFGSYVLIVYTVALKKMVQFGLVNLGLDKDRVVYEWSWKNRGIEVSGDVFALKGDNAYGLNKDFLIVTDNDDTACYICSEIYEQAVRKGTASGFSIRKSENPLEISIDFGDWVESRFYYTFYRRSRWFTRVDINDINFDTASERFVFISSGFVFKKKEAVDYMIIDEAQDFSVADISDTFRPDVKKSLTLFGDSLQQIYADRGVSMDVLQAELQVPRMFLKYNYRLPKSIAKIAQVISSPHQDLLTHNRKNQGNSDYPDFAKPVIKKLGSRKQELEYIWNTIKLESLDDVGILVPGNDDISEVYEFFKSKNTDIQVRYTIDYPQNRLSGTYPMFRTIDTLDFSNNDLPCVLTYHSSKGTEFENVFVPFSDNGDLKSRNPFYVAVTRSSSRLFITYSKQRTSFLSDVSKDHITELL